MVKDRLAVLRPKQVRGHNSAAVLGFLRRFETMSRAELSRQSGLSEGTVSRIVAALCAQRLVSEIGEENTTGGRPSTRLQLSDVPRAIGVEIKNWETRFAISTLRGQLTETLVVRTPASPELTVQLIAEQARRYAKLHPCLHGVGVAVRGLVDSRTGVVAVGNDPGWLQVPLKDLLAKRLALPIWVENDVRAATQAEYYYTNGGGHAPRCLLYVNVTEGVGVGIVMNGTIYAGASMASGEFGQMVIADDGGDLRHDRPGCLEMLVSDQAVCDRFAQQQGKKSSRAADSAARVRRICRLAMEGDRDAEEAVRQTVRYLALGVANMAFALDPEVIILNTTLNPAWPLLMEGIRAQLPDKAQWPAFQKLSILPSVLGEEGALIGAATLPFAPLFESVSTGMALLPEQLQA